jgi:hypothetical protein
MKVLLESTSKIVHLNGVPARVWEGATESGIKVNAFITRIAVHKDEDSSEFEVELKEQKTPSAEVQAIPLSMII